MTEVDPRISRTARALAGLLLVTMAFELVVLGGRLASGALATANTCLYDGAIVGAAALCALRAATRRRERLVWALMACAIACWAAGEVYYDVAFPAGTTAPIPSLADLLWLSFYPLAYGAIVALVRSRLPQLPGSLWIDGLIGALGVASLSASVVLEAVIEGTHGSFAVVATGIAYPVADLVLLAMLVAVGIAGRRHALDGAWLLLGAGLALFGVGDSIYLLQTAHGSYVPNGPLDITWPLALVLLACAAWAPRRRGSLHAPAAPTILTPVLLSMLALAVLIIDHFERVDLAAIVLAGLCIVTVAIRLVLAFREASRAAIENAAARDQAMEALDAKSLFVATVSHELRAPLNGVIGMTGLLLEGELSAQQREYAEIVRASGEGLLLVINDILDYSKMEAGKVELEVADFALRETIAEGCATLLVLAREKGLELELNFDAELPAWLRGDAGRLRQVVINLVSNAVKFTERGRVVVSVSGSTLAGATLVRVEVADSGIGIDARALARLFQPFNQADSSTSRRYGGTGLGLTISARLVELMGGTIGATSVPGEGSRFYFEVPLLAGRGAPASAEAHAAPPAAGERDASGQLTDAAPLVLVAEDSPVNQLLAVRLLDQCGYRAEVVADGRAALEAVERGEYAAVLMDCQMPELDGYEATGEIRRREGPGRHLPIIAMTANSMADDRERCLAAGMDDYVSKPIRPQLLAEALGRCIRGGGGRTAPRATPAEITGDLLDPTTLAELRELHADGLRDLLELYFDDVASQMPRLVAALERGEVQSVAVSAHRLKGASLAVGAQRVSAIAAELEVRARAEDREGAAQLLSSLERAVADTTAALRAESAGVRSGAQRG